MGERVVLNLESGNLGLRLDVSKSLCFPDHLVLASLAAGGYNSCIYLSFELDLAHTSTYIVDVGSIAKYGVLNKY
jgi:hypothetical protein